MKTQRTEKKHLQRDVWGGNKFLNDKVDGGILVSARWEKYTPPSLSHWMQLINCRQNAWIHYLRMLKKKNRLRRGTQFEVSSKHFFPSSSLLPGHNMAATWNGHAPLFWFEGHEGSLLTLRICERSNDFPSFFLFSIPSLPSPVHHRTR